MRKSQKGFTMIELLAVIVIIGLLVAIAVPGVTKYITESRRKTVASSIDGYIASVEIDVNSKKYKFTKENTIYAVPIECVSLEKGGQSPFGEWSPANNEYWAYVLVQYNRDKYTHTYGFTFKDSAGYGIYPTEQNEVNLKNPNQIKIGLNLTKPANGLATSIAPKEYWNRFEIDDNTKLVVLESDTCGLPKPCTGEGTDVGDIITCGSESFNVISSTPSTVTVLAKSPINPDLSNPIQAPDASGVTFSQTNYWVNGSTLKSKYGSSYPAYVYDENSNLYQYVEAYESYLKQQGVTSSSASLISHEQFEALGCPVSQTICNLGWLKTGPTVLFWLGSANSNLAINRMMTPANHFNTANYNSFNYTIRPIVTISKTEIKFN